MLKKINWKKILLTITKFTWRLSCLFLRISFAITVWFIDLILGFEPKPESRINHLHLKDEFFDNGPYSHPGNMYGLDGIDVSSQDEKGIF